MTELLDRIKAALADRYRIEREIGSGGMATVYLAEDLRHDRQVAIKVLRPDLAATLGHERFHREIKIAARLQHPNILPLLDSGEAPDPTGSATAFLYYVMPYIEGQSLRDKLVKEGELPIGDAVRLIRDVVDALTEAHAHGVVHRDIKPENILLRGRHALVTDFGVAKAVSDATGREQLTTAGVALGTPAYMAPEQASADPNVDHRVDIYAVGAVAYELLTGRPVFMGTTPQMVLAAHVTETAQPVMKHRDTVPAALDHLVMRCLEKKPGDRWQTAEELLLPLEALATPSGGVTPAATQPMQAVRAPRRGVVAVLGVSLAALVLAFVFLRPSPALSPLTLGQTSQVTLAPELELDPALSPDGQMLAYASGSETETKIYVRSVAGGAAVAVTEDVPGMHRMPQWSPDGTQILFTGDRGVYVVPQLGGHARLLVASESAPMVGGPSVGFAVWSPDGTEMAYGRAEPTAVTSGGVPDLNVYVKPVAGGESRLLAGGDEIHSLSWSRDGRFLAYVSGNMQYAYGGTLMGNLGPSAIYVVPAEGGEPIDVTSRQFLHMSPIWSPDSRSLLFVSSRGGGRDVYRVAIGDNGERRGEMERLTNGANVGTISLAANGSRLAYSVFTNTANIWSVQIPRTGTVSVREAESVTRGTQHIEGIDVTADGQWLTFDSDRGGNVDIYKMRLDGGEPIQLTSDPSDDFIPAWSPDGRWIVFHSWRHGNRDVFVISSEGGVENQVTSHGAHDYYGRWSPDGTRLAFFSERSGANEIFTVERTNAGGWTSPERLPTVGGLFPDWSPDGSAVAYMVADGVHLHSLADGSDRLLFSAVDPDGNAYSTVFARYAPDGRTIYVKVSAQDGGQSIWAVPAAGGAPRLVMVFDDPSRPSSRQEFATDGERLYFTIDNRQSDIWVMDVDGWE